MPRVRPNAFLAAPLAALLAAAAPLRAVPPPEPPRRVVLVSFDGAGGLEYARQREALSPDGFRRAEREGASAERLRPVTPSLTAVAHASLSTGALPQATGIVSNTYHPAGGPLKARLSGFDAEPESETLWEALARQGRRVASLCWPGVTGRTPRATTPVGFRWVGARSPGFRWSGPAGRDGSVARPLDFVLLDSVDDGRREYDSLAALDVGGGLAARLHAGAWAALPERSEGVALRGRWVKVLRLAPDGSSVSLYVGGVTQTEAWPEDFQRTLDRRCGFWPGEPDHELVEGPEPDVKTFLEMAERLSTFLVGAYEVAERRGDWDLLLAYQPLLDETAHALTPAPPEPTGAETPSGVRSAAGIREAWRIADRAAARYLRFLERGGDVVLVSDHGLRPVRRTVFPAELLRREGWISTDLLGGRVVVKPDSPADCLVSAGTALVVLNRAGDMPGGVLSPEEAAALLADAAALFRSLKDETGAPLFETVALREEASALGLDHSNAGDLVLLAGDGTNLRSGFPRQGASAPLLLPPDVAAQHGYGPAPELDGLFFHVGPGVEASRVPLAGAVDVAPRIAARMGISPPGAK